MGSSRALFCTAAFLWAVLGAAHMVAVLSPNPLQADETPFPEHLMLQRPVIPELEMLQRPVIPAQEMLQRPVIPELEMRQRPVIPEREMLQRPVIPELEMLQRPVIPKREMLQRPVIPEREMLQRETTDFTGIFQTVLTSQPEDDSVQYELPVERYPVAFPLARPTPDNLEALCRYRNRRPRYPPSYFPLSGFGSQFRQGKAVNQVESWFSFCCNKGKKWEKDVKLCCVNQAWEQSIESYCREEFSIKTSHYHCCHREGEERLNCFNDNAVNPNYEATLENPVRSPKAKFNFDPNKCSTYAGN